MSTISTSKNDIKGWVVSVAIHVLLLLIAVFFVTCWQQQIPAPDPGQGIELSFGTISEAVGETENPLTNGQQAEEIQETQEEVQEQSEETPVEESSAPVEEESTPIEDEPQESEDLNPEITETSDPSTPVETPSVTETPESVESENDTEVKPTETKPAETKPAVPALPGLPGVKPGGSGNKQGQVGSEKGKSVSLSSGLGTAEIPNGWAMSTEPTPDIQKDGVVVISVEFNRNGDYVWNSARYVSGDHSLFSTYKNSKIEESLRTQLKLSTDGTIAPKVKNIATFRFEFKGH